MCRIGVCGAFGVLAILLYVQGLYWFLVPGFKLAPLLGGPALLLIVALRVLSLWVQISKPPGEFKIREKERGLWRYVILLLPILFYLLDFYYPDYSVLGYEDDRDEALAIGLKELTEAASTPSSREAYEGKTVKIIGQYAPGDNDKTCKLIRYPLFGNDGWALVVVVQIDPASPAHLPEGLTSKWVQVTGQVRFLPDPKHDGAWLSVIVLKPKDQDELQTNLKEIPRPANL
jgi:hypothetical protein